MKGFTDKSGKFRPTENKKGVRKSRDQSTKNQGIKLVSLRKQRDEDPEPILETEMVDILEDVTGTNDPNAQINYRILERVTRENIQEILENNGRWESGYVVDVQLVTARNDSAMEGGFYHYDYQISRNRRHLPLSGTVYGDISGGDMIDMNLELYNQVSW